MRVILAFAEFIEDVRYLIKKGLCNSDTTIIALGADAVMELKKNNIPFRCPEAFIDKDEHNSLIDDSLDEVKGLIKFLYEEMRDIDDAEIVISSFEGSLWKLCANEMLKRYVLKKIILAYKPHCIVYFKPVLFPIIYDLTLSSYESFYSYILPSVIEEYGDNIKVIFYPGRVRKGCEGSIIFLRRILSTCKKLTSMKKEIFDGMTMIVEDSREIDLYFKNSGTDYFTWAFRDILPINPFEGRFTRIKRFLSNIVRYYRYRKLFLDMWELCKKRGYEAASSINNLICTPLGERVFRHIFSQNMPIAKILLDETEYLFNKVKIFTIISSDSCYYYSAIVMKSAKKKSIPRICIQHGLLDFQQNPFEKYICTQNFSHLFTFGETVLQKKLFPDLTIRTVGSLWFEETLKQKRKRKNMEGVNILYPLNVWQNDYITYNYIGGTYYFNMTIKILDFIAGFTESDAKCFVKLYPNIYLNQDILLDRYKDCNSIEFIKSGSVSEHVNDFDIMLLDWPSSSLIEGIAADMDIIVLNKVIKVSSDVLTFFLKRAFYTEDEDIFFEELKNIIKNGRTAAIKKRDSSFETGYISPSRDGRNIERYKDAFKDIF